MFQERGVSRVEGEGVSGGGVFQEWVFLEGGLREWCFRVRVFLGGGRRGGCFRRKWCF